MPNTYPIITPPTLPNLNTSVKQDGTNTSPLDTEPVSILGAVCRQTRQFLYDFLSSVFDASGNLLPTSVNNNTLAGKVSGATANGGTSQSVVAGTISDVDIRNAAITASKLAANAVTTTAINPQAVTTTCVANQAITATQIANATITSTQLAAQAVGTGQLANLAVTSGQLADASVTLTKVPDNTLTPTKFANALSAGQLLVSNSSGVWTAVTPSGDVTVSSAGVFSVTNKSLLILAEQFPNGVGAGNSAASWASGTAGGTPNIRGAGIGTSTWNAVFNSFPVSPTFANADGRIDSLPTGKYLVEASVPAYNISGSHVCAIKQFSSGGVLRAYIMGTSEQCPAGSQTRTIVAGQFTIASGDYLQVIHLTQFAQTSGLGLAIGAGTNESFTQVKLQYFG